VVQPPNSAKQAPTPAAASSLSKWIDPKRKRFWAIALVLLYTLGGFFGVPALVKSQIIAMARDDLGREARIQRVRFNPYVLSLEISGFQLTDPDGSEHAAFERLFVNLQLSSVVRWAWTFREIRLEGLDLLYERFAAEDSRLSRLLEDQASRTVPAAPEADDSGGLPRLLVSDLVLAEGRIRFRDHVPADEVNLEFGPVSVSVHDLNTLPDRSGQQSVSVRLPGDAHVSWQGSLDLGPLQSEGVFVVENSHLDQTIAYLQAILPLQAMQAVLSLQTNYRVSEREDGNVEFELDQLEVDLQDVAISGLTPETEFIAFSSLALTGGALQYPGNRLGFATVRLSNPRVSAWLDESGVLSLQQLAPSDPAVDDTQDAPSTESEPWSLAIEEFSIVDGQVGFTDRSMEPRGAIELRGVNVTLRNVSNEENAQMPVAFSAGLEPGGLFEFDGQITALPEVTVVGSITASEIPLTLAQPYAQQHVNILINEGTLSASADLTLQADGNVEAAGELAVVELRVDDTLEDLPLVGIGRLDIDRFEASTASRRLGLSLVQFRQPFGRLIIKEDLTTNVSGLPVAADAASEPAEPADPDTPPWTVIIGGTAVSDGSMDFSDLSLPLPFATHIRKLEGTISTVDTSSSSPADIRLEGQVDEYGLARIEGAMDLLDPVRSTDVTMEFRNLLMSNLSPYSVEFAGRKIDEGKLDLDLGYRITDGQLQGRNAVVMSDLVLGEEVESPNAVSLPLGLAVALLTDANGVIDIDLPVEGDINDPEFRIGGVIWKAFAGLITKVVSAPFRLLGSLIGIESEDLGQFEFLAGRTDLTPPELEKISQLLQALQQRPELAIEVSGAFDPAIDVPALQYQRLRAVVVERVGEDYAGDEDFRMLNEEIQSVIEALFVERFPETPLEPLKSTHTAPPADDLEGKPVLDQLAYTTELRDRLLASETVGPPELEALANARAAAIRDAFLATGEIEESRVVLAAPTATESDDGEWVVMELGVLTD
jgi:uncharacterized protein involved in outer membrane biogenesis